MPARHNNPPSWMVRGYPLLEIATFTLDHRISKKNEKEGKPAITPERRALIEKFLSLA